MEFKGTKGNWHAISPYENNDHLLLDENHFQIGIIQEEYVKSAERIKANAKLISKAPEMLEMLIRCYNINSIAREHINDDLFKDLEKLIKEATTI